MMDYKRIYGELCDAAAAEAVAECKRLVPSGILPKIYLYVGPAGVGGLRAAQESPGAGWQLVRKEHFPLDRPYDTWASWVKNRARNAEVFQGDYAVN